MHREGAIGPGTRRRCVSSGHGRVVISGISLQTRSRDFLTMNLLTMHFVGMRVTTQSGEI